MKKKKFSVLTFSCFLVLHVTCSEHNVVSIDGGLIRGEDSILGYEYRGIPYAEPPVGLLRFANPKPYNHSWDGVTDYVKFGPSCAQYSHFGYIFLGEEDCLTLNVYVPRAVKEGTVKAPVIFFIHSGNFMYGGSNVYGPENFLNNQNMILVTLNYRVGVLGFLSTEDQALPGNFGLKDQVEAMKWVQRNIEAFNGDPKQVTIAGLSAGGASVHLHYMSPLTEGLFNNGISHSGCALNPWVMQERAKEKAYDLGSVMECEFTDHVSLVKCLRTKPVEDLVMFAKRYQLFMYNPISPFAVVIEAPSETAFITESPLSYLKSGKFKAIPWLLSQTQDEGLYPAAEFAEIQKMNVVNDRWLELAPNLMDYDNANADDETKMRWSVEIKDKYFDSNLISLETFGGFRQMMTDRLYHHGAYKALQYHSKKAETYFYLFSMTTLNILPIDPEWGTNFVAYNDELDMEFPLAPGNLLGVAPGDDTFLIFFNLDSRGPGKVPYTNQEKLMSKLLLDMYYTFASTGKPMLGDVAFIPVKGDGTLAANEINNMLNLIQIQLNSTFGAVEFWDSLKITET